MVALLLFFIGLFFGSFLNVVVIRIHEDKRSWMSGRSACMSCAHVLAWYDLVPVFSYLLLQGRCRYCRNNISIQYPLVEFVTGILFALTYISTFGVIQGADRGFLDAIVLIRNLFVVSVMVVLFVYDYRWQLLPDRITIPSFCVMLIANSLLHISARICDPMGGSCYLIPGWTDYLVGAILGGGFFLLQYVISKGKWIGGGDIRLGALIGAILGIVGTAIALFIAYMIGALCGVYLILKGKQTMESAVPLGTFLTIATVIVLLWYTPITTFLSTYFIL